MVFLSPYLDVTKVSFSTVSFLLNLDPGILCLQTVFSVFNVTQTALVLGLIGIFDLGVLFNPFQLGGRFHTAFGHLICIAKQINGFYIKRNTGLKKVEQL